MAQPQNVVQPEKDLAEQTTANPSHHFEPFPSLGQLHRADYRSSVLPFVGRLGGNQAAVLDRRDERNQKFLQQAPDAAPYMSLQQQFDPKPFLALGLWNAALIEGVGKSCTLGQQLSDQRV